jgi:hypothetical protein
VETDLWSRAHCADLAAPSRILPVATSMIRRASAPFAVGSVAQTWRPSCRFCAMLVRNERTGSAASRAVNATRPGQILT